MVKLLVAVNLLVILLTGVVQPEPIVTTKVPRIESTPKTSTIVVTDDSVVLHIELGPVRTFMLAQPPLPYLGPGEMTRQHDAVSRTLNRDYDAFCELSFPER